VRHEHAQGLGDLWVSEAADERTRANGKGHPRSCVNRSQLARRVFVTRPPRAANRLFVIAARPCLTLATRLVSF
jgi:hypothetical protein